jgi:hypothetical protein
MALSAGDALEQPPKKKKASMMMMMMMVCQKCVQL